jgi:hypothetical protein
MQATVVPHHHLKKFYLADTFIQIDLQWTHSVISWLITMYIRASFWADSQIWMVFIYLVKKGTLLGHLDDIDRLHLLSTVAHGWKRGSS